MRCEVEVGTWRPFFFGNHLILFGKTLGISVKTFFFFLFFFFCRSLDLGQKNALNFGEDLFFFWRSLDFGQKNTIQDKWKFVSSSFTVESNYKKASPLPLSEILATRLTQMVDENLCFWPAPKKIQLILSEDLSFFFVLLILGEKSDEKAKN